MSSTFLLIDGHALIYRAFHAYPELTNPEGELVNAVYGFARILLTVIRNQEPEYVAVAFDHRDPTFRHQAFTEYKAHRVAMPEEMRPQIDLIKEVVQVLNMPTFELAGYEADDLVGTLSLQAAKTKEQPRVIILTGDKDMLQLVDAQTFVFIPGRGKASKDVLYDEAKVIDKLGVGPSQVTELKALMGDASDNIPGVRGIGAKTAAKLIAHFTSVEQLYQHIENGGGLEAKAGLSAATLEKLVADKAAALMSRELATIKRDVPLTLALSDCRVKGYAKEKAVAVFNRHGFSSLMNLLPEDEFEEAVQDALF